MSEQPFIDPREPVPLSLLLGIAREHGIDRQGRGPWHRYGDRMQFAMPPGFILGPDEIIPDSYHMEVRAVQMERDERRMRYYWAYTGKVMLDAWHIEADERYRNERHQEQIVSLNRTIANLNGEIADLKRLFGHSTDNSPALGGQKET